MGRSVSSLWLSLRMQLLRFCKVVLTIVFSAALAKSFDGDHSEPSLLTWGISESEVLDLASNHRQEAIFRLTPDEVEIVGTYPGVGFTLQRSWAELPNAVESVRP